MDAAVERQIERDLLEEALLANEAASGPIPQEFKDEALRSVRPAVILTSDADDIRRLCGKEVRIVQL